MNLFQKVFGTRSEHEVKRIMPLVEKTESLRPEMQKLTMLPKQKSFLYLPECLPRPNSRSRQWKERPDKFSF